MALTPETAARKDRTTGRGSVEMQHRHFAAIADMINQRFVRVQDNTGWTGKEIAEVFAQELSHTNARFDRQRFLAACGF